MAFCRKKNQKLLFKVDSLLNFRMWFKYGLKAQKLLAQGIALGIIAISKAPCNNPGRCPGLGASALSGRVELTCETLIPLSSECSVKSVGLKNNNLWDFL